MVRWESGRHDEEVAAVEVDSCLIRDIETYVSAESVEDLCFLADTIGVGRVDDSHRCTKVQQGIGCCVPGNTQTCDADPPLAPVRLPVCAPHIRHARTHSA